MRSALLSAHDTLREKLAAVWQPAQTPHATREVDSSRRN
jgi:hypothetical protein